MIIAHMTEKEKAFFEKIFANKDPLVTILVLKEAMTMDKQDLLTEQQVWQRVRSCREEGEKQDLRQLQREAMELAALYRNLSSQMTGKLQEQVKQLYMGEKANAAALAGIGMLSHQQGENLKLWSPGREEPQRMLEKCYHRTRRCLTEYMARSADGEFGVVFQKMAEREIAHCVLIAELLGSGKG